MKRLKKSSSAELNIKQLNDKRQVVVTVTEAFAATQNQVKTATIS